MKTYTILLFLILSIELFSQQSHEGTIWFRPSDKIKPSQIKAYGKLTVDDKLNRIFEKRKVTDYKQALPFAKNPKLREIFEITYNGNADSLLSELKEDDRIRDVWRIPDPIPTYDPSDYMWYLYDDDGFTWLWHLKAIQADNAWDITKGDPNVKIAIIDTDFDLTHPDLSGQFDPNYDPLTGISHSAIKPSHGTAVASFAAAKTDGGGQLASVGFNCKMIGYTWDNGLAKALHASNVMHADVISISWYYLSCNSGPDDSLIINEILDNGTIIVAAAGNGPNFCGGGEIPPFVSTFDDRLIKVTSTDRYDKHQYIVSGIDKTHSLLPFEVVKLNELELSNY